MKGTIASVVICVALALPSAAQARHKHKRTNHTAPVESTCLMTNEGRTSCVAGFVNNGLVTADTGSVHTSRSYRADTGSSGDPRPRAWCAWWLRRYLGIPKSVFPNGAYNLARAFARIGQPAQKGCVGCIAVFSRGGGGHVGVVKSWDANGNPVILSGNYNHGVGVGPRPVSRLIALRYWSA